MLRAINNWYLTVETNTQKGPSAEDQEALRIAQNCIRECHLEQLITESKFLRLDSLQYFVKVFFFFQFFKLKCIFTPTLLK